MAMQRSVCNGSPRYCAIGGLPGSRSRATAAVYADHCELCALRFDFDDVIALSIQ